MALSLVVAVDGVIGFDFVFVALPCGTLPFCTFCSSLSGCIIGSGGFSFCIFLFGSCGLVDVGEITAVRPVRCLR